MISFIKVGHCASFFLCILFSSFALSELPRLSIQDLVIDAKLSTREAYVLEQLAWPAMLREAIVDARFFSVVTRDDARMQAMLKERSLSQSSLARKPAPEKFGTDIVSYFLYPTLKRFDVYTSYEPMDMLPGMYERKDSIHMEFYVEVVDAGGNIVFDDFVTKSKHYNSGEATEAQKKRNKTRHLASFKAEGRKTVRQAVDAIMARVNPIIILDVEGSLLILDRGRNNGFVKDSEILIYGKGREVTHPTTGKVRKIYRRKGKAKITAVYEDMAEAKLIEGDISTVQAGSTVRLIKE